jgi:Family of unknown function (DUF5906)
MERPCPSTAHTMPHFNDIRRALQGIALFILYRLEPRADGKLDKIPTSPLHGCNIDAGDSREWMTPEEASFWAEQFNLQPMPAGVTGYGVGVVITDTVVLPNGRRLFCLDIDKCRDGDRWAPHASAFLAKLAGGGTEVSISNLGLHQFGTYAGDRPAHGTRNKTYGLELYTGSRFIATTGTGAVGDPLADLTAELHSLIRDYFPPHEEIDYGGQLTVRPVPEWSGPTDDDELLRRAMRSFGTRQVWGGRASFADIFSANVAVLSRVFPPQQYGVYDASAADQALANHLAFWTGNHGERIFVLMQRSGLVRDKWSRPDYLHRTIQNACGTQHEWYKGTQGMSTPDQGLDLTQPVAALNAPQAGAPPAPVQVSNGSAPQLSERVVLGHDEEQDLAWSRASNNALPPPPANMAAIAWPPNVGDLLILPQQQRMFEGCVYVEDINQVMMPDGQTLNAERFDARFSGFEFSIRADGTKPAKRAWETFVFSELYQFPKVNEMFFDPRVPPKTIIEKDHRTAINSYVPSIIVRKQGDISPFLTHLYKLLPHGNDAQILLAYFAACVQYPGEKFQWWPLIQGVEGNGKTTLSYLLEYAVGERYVHWPKASELGNRFNAALYGKLLICCEDVQISEQRGSLWETLKPMITGVKLEIEAKGVNKVTREVCFNGVMNSNHKNAIRKTANDRRICPFFCAQQTKEELARDGMAKDYFKALRSWRLGEGRPIVADYLLRFEIPDQWNPTLDCHVAPDTTATREAINVGLGAAEQEVMEAIGQGLPGFRGGWVSSSALDRLLAAIGKGGAIPRNRRRELLEGLGYRPHPALPDGRAPSPDHDGSRPVLYVQATSAALGEASPTRVMELYQQAQAPG